MDASTTPRRAAAVEPLPDQLRRAAMHAALGEPLRLAIVEDLVRSDRSPGEVASRFGLATNLVAHHLDVLAAAGLIERFTSSGDKRRRYVRLSLAAASDVLGPLRAARAEPAARVLFVCSANSARSQLAAALWRARTGGEADSAGTEPADAVHPGAVAAAQRAGLDLSGARPRLLDAGESADVVITVCDRAHEELAPGPDWWHWSTPDPVAAPEPGEAGRAVEAGLDAFDLALAQLDRRIRATAHPSPMEQAS
jgi:ArsR family transcriptional regulator, arsenate/arsenite/antimonite-responsive transcriptional repressor / arsenate reductase (thioredoxin)